MTDILTDENDAAPIISSQLDGRRYLLASEVEVLMAAARKRSRYGHRDATMILLAYRHGLRAVELCELQWRNVELNTGRLHVRRVKAGTPSVHHLLGNEIRARFRRGKESQRGVSKPGRIFVPCDAVPMGTHSTD